MFESFDWNQLNIFGPESSDWIDSVTQVNMSLILKWLKHCLFGLSRNPFMLYCNKVEGTHVEQDGKPLSYFIYCMYLHTHMPISPALSHRVDVLNIILYLWCFSSWVSLGKPNPPVAIMGDDSEWMKLPIDQKCEHKVMSMLHNILYSLSFIPCVLLPKKKMYALKVAGILHHFPAALWHKMQKEDRK